MNSVVQVLDLPVNTDTGLTSVSIDKNANDIFSEAVEYYDEKE